MKVGVIGDTHGVVHRSLEDIFSGADRIIHTGDAGGRAVIDHLESIAHVTAVRGNYDHDPELSPLLLDDPSMIELSGLSVFLTHRMIMMEWESGKEAMASLFLKSPAPPDAVIFGHTHFPVFEKVCGIWFINPGYAGPDPHEADPTAALIHIEGKEIEGRIVKI